MKEELIKDGWNLTEEGIEFCKKEWTKSGKKQTPLAHDIKNIALNIDITNIGEGCIPEELKNGKLKKLPKCLTLQITKVRNLTAPQANQTSNHAPRMLQIYMSDGHRTCQAIEHEKVSQLSLETSPGTKVNISTEVGISSSGVLLISPETFKILGGKVDNLYKKWMASKEACGYSREVTSGNNPPPPFVPFGKSIEQRYSSGTKTDKLLGQVEEEAASSKNNDDDDDEFEQQRRAQIEKVAKSENEGKKFTARPVIKSDGDNNTMATTSGRFMHQRGGDRGGRRGDYHQQRAAGREGSDQHRENVGQLVQMGFNARAAAQKLRDCGNDIEAALNSLLVEGGGQQAGDRRSSGRDAGHHRHDSRGGAGRRGAPRGGGRGRGRGRRGGDDEDDDVTTASSKGGATLFDFLQTKIPATTTSSAAPSGGGEGTSQMTSWADDAAAEEEEMLKYAISVSKLETHGFGAGYGGVGQPTSSGYASNRNPYQQQQQDSNGIRSHSSSGGRNLTQNDRPGGNNNSGMHDRFARYNNNTNDRSQRNNSKYNNNNRQYSDRQQSQPRYDRRTNSESERPEQKPYNNRQGQTNYDNNRPAFNSSNNRQQHNDNNRQSFNRQQQHNDISIPPFNSNTRQQQQHNDNSIPPFNNRQQQHNDNSRPPFNSNNRQQHNDNSRPPFNSNNRQQQQHNDNSRPPFNSNTRQQQQHNDNSKPPFNSNNKEQQQYNDNSRPPFNSNTRQQHNNSRPTSSNSNYKQQPQYNRQHQNNDDNRQAQYDDRQSFNSNNRPPYNDNYRPNSSNSRYTADRQPYNNNKQNNSRSTSHDRRNQQQQQQQHQRHPDMQIYQPPTVRHTAVATSAAATHDPPPNNLGGEFDRKLTLGETGNRNKKMASAPSSGSKLRVGDLVMACYWEDKKYYEARVVDVHETKPFLVVEFTEYGNCEEVHINSVRSKEFNKNASTPPSHNQPIRSAEFRSRRR